jgi:hypothetical protein
VLPPSGGPSNVPATFFFHASRALTPPSPARSPASVFISAAVESAILGAQKVFCTPLVSSFQEQELMQKLLQGLQKTEDLAVANAANFSLGSYNFSDEDKEALLSDSQKKIYTKKIFL